MKRARFAVLLLSGLMVLVYSCVEKGSTWRCAKDTDCPGSLICNAKTGFCESPPPCTFDSDCGENEICTDIGLCEEAPSTKPEDKCVFDADCNEGQLCTDAGICVWANQVVDGDTDSNKEDFEETADTEELNEQDTNELTDAPTEVLDTTEAVDNQAEIDNQPSNDRDHDGVPDNQDNCPTVANPNQEDTDNDGVGDFCDNCIFAQNPDQSDRDNDTLGDLCDPTPDQANVCAMVPCHPYRPDIGNPCGNFGLECHNWNVNAGECTKNCHTDQDCPLPYYCINGRCQCEATQFQCPSGECTNMRDCWNAGFPQESRCLLPQGACSMPCDGKPENYCQEFFGSEHYHCVDIGSGYGSWCVCSD